MPARLDRALLTFAAGITMLSVAAGCSNDDGAADEGDSAEAGDSTEAGDTAEAGDDDTNGGSGPDLGGDGDGDDDGAIPPPCDDGVPANADALLAYLQNGDYTGMQAESGPHDSAGPHFGDVRTFVGDCLADSLDAQNAQHPVGAASIKELYGDGDTVLGWAVEVKQAEGIDEGWYWYEYYQGSVFADGVDVGLCQGCHASGIDSFRSPWPLQ